MTPDRPAIALMRSVLTVPVIVERFLQKAPSSGADVICLDLEDSVPPAEKARARTLAAEAIASLSASSPLPRVGRGAGGEGSSLLVRVNGLTTGLFEDDLIAVVRPGLDGVVVSKAESPEDMRRVGHYLTVLERERGMDSMPVAIVPLIETALGIVRSYEICASSARIAGAVFGAEDYATDMGIQRTAEGEEVRWARTQVAIACRAAGVVAIDTPDPDYSDEGHLEREMAFARSIGYRGKLCIHPTQVAIANRVFRPATQEIDEARAIVDLFEREGIAKGRAAIPVDGRMIDTPIYLRAKSLLDWATKVSDG